MIRSRPLPALTALVALAASLVLAACSSGPSRNPDEPFVGPPTEVRWMLYRTGQTITLVNDSHTDRLELYSQVRESAGPKVASDADVDALVGFFEEQDFDRHAQGGPAPTTAVGDVTQALELTIDGRTRHMLLGPGSSVPQRKTFNSCATALTTLWNLTFQSQAVENDEGAGFFKGSDAPARDKGR